MVQIFKDLVAEGEGFLKESEANITDLKPTLLHSFNPLHLEISRIYLF